MLFGFEHTLAAGYLTLSATVTTRKIGDQISSGTEGCFMHGQTSMANPLACAVAGENLLILMEGKWKSLSYTTRSTVKKKELLPLLEQSIVADGEDLRCYIGVVEVTKRERRSPARAVYQGRSRLDLR
ncbi:CPA_1a_G0000920.mRNA.1.CDS.1 [Saccharomyces cerevisiae]|nr:CPA_1a_G0000920.mRNA.1.CDS.1 [Saccharomyces cerevisiae]CAI7129841.1 CPA_1a_G0000920.mRNA.1.CDS.1 [Saccharomyces cerevisiae]